MSGPESIWDFALRVYAADAVEEACLHLQDRWHADIPVLLFCLWAGAGGRLLSTADFEEISAAVSAWQNEVIRPIRDLRRQFRAVAPEAPILSRSLQSVRGGLHEVELTAERSELELLSTSTLGTDSEPGTPSISANLINYLSFLEVPTASHESYRFLVERAAG